MSDTRLALPIGLAVVAIAAAGCGDGNDEGSASTVETVAADITTTETSTTGLPKLIGTVGSTDDPDAYEIRLTTENGAEVTTTLPPGEYMLEINDLSTIHNFHLGGPRAAVDVATDVAGTGEKTAIVLLQEPESYIYVCDAHPTTMMVTFSIHGRIRTQN
jgi:plastocyanin